MSDDKTEQNNEIEALYAIYGSEWRKELKIDNSFYIQLSGDIQLSITLPSDYPSQKAPIYQLLAPTLSKEQKTYISKQFDEIYNMNIGGPVLFQWIEKLKEIVESSSNAPDECSVEVTENPAEEKKPFNFNIIRGPIIQDRKSVFQGHVCAITTKQDVKYVMEILLENKKIFQATHNITAYRIKSPNGNLIQDCNDDGETHAGGRLLHLLQIVDAVNVLIVVSRWYGGIQLGPDRFRHINNAARDALEQAHFINKKT